MLQAIFNLVACNRRVLILMLFAGGQVLLLAGVAVSLVLGMQAKDQDRKSFHDAVLLKHDASQIGAVRETLRMWEAKTKLLESALSGQASQQLLSEMINRMALDHHLHLNHESYGMPIKQSADGSIELRLDLSGTYVDCRNYLAALQQAPMVLVIDSASLTAADQGLVQLRLVTRVFGVRRDK